MYPYYLLPFYCYIIEYLYQISNNFIEILTVIINFQTNRMTSYLFCYFIEVHTLFSPFVITTNLAQFSPTHSYFSTRNYNIQIRAHHRHTLRPPKSRFTSHLSQQKQFFFQSTIRLFVTRTHVHLPIKFSSIRTPTTLHHCIIHRDATRVLQFFVSSLRPRLRKAFITDHVERQ